MIWDSEMVGKREKKGKEKTTMFLFTTQCPEGAVLPHIPVTLDTG